MLTDNISVCDRLIKGSIGTVKYLDRRSKPLYSAIYVKFDDPKAGISLKDRRLCSDLKECVPIPVKKRKSTAIAERKQFLLILGHAIIVHKSRKYFGLYSC